MKTKSILFTPCFFFFFLFSFSAIGQTPGEWTWMHGDNTANTPGVFGTQGVANPGNKPPGVYEPCDWKDNNGNFWVLGGSGSGVEYAALWKYDVPTNQWTWMKGPAAGNQAPVYGTQGVPALANHPGSRANATTTWTDLAGNLWLFGGFNSTLGIYNDLWKYDIGTNEWTWMKGPSVTGNTGSYGTKGVPNASNVPPARYETSSSWIDSTGDLWFYGGCKPGNAFADLWKYNIGTNMWTWMHGVTTFNSAPVYGTQGVPAPANTPGGRIVYASWVDLNNNLWLFGGYKVSSGSYNDLWKYNITTNQWTWVKGSNTVNNTGSYGSKCISANSNVPPSRDENRARVRDACGNFWNFGGTGAGGAYNDLWHYNVSTNQWTWVSGDNTTFQAAVFGTLGVSDPANKPGAKVGSVAWIDNSGNIWLFGGSNSNDLFRFVPDPACTPVSAVVIGSANTTICPGQNATLTASGGTTYSWSPGGQSTSTIVISPTTSTTYTVTGGGLCGSGTDSVRVTVSSLPPVITTSSNTTICNGQSITLTASGGTTYSWTPGGQSSSSIVVNPTMLTTYTVTGSNSCSSSSSTVTVTVEPSITAAAGPNTTICSGQSATLTASGGGNYSWNTTETTPSISVSPNTNTTYSVVVSIGTCTATASAAVVVNPNPIVSSAGNATISQGQSTSLSASGGGNYSWSPVNDLSCTTCANPTATPSQTTSYCVVVTDGNGCADSTCITITIDLPCGTIYIPNAFSPNNDTENDFECVFGNCIEIFHIKIYDRWGEKVFESNDQAVCWDGMYKGKMLNSAVFNYYLEATMTNGAKISKQGNISLIK